MRFELGVVCGGCDRYSRLGTSRCACGEVLALAATLASETASDAVSDMKPSEGHPGRAPPPAALFPQSLAALDDLAELGGEPSPGSESAASSARPSRPDGEPLPSLFTADELRRRRPTAVSSSSRVPAALPHRVQDIETGLSSALGFDEDDRANVGPVSPRSEASSEELMDQAKNYVCRSCSTPVPLGHKFCGRCGAAIPPEIVNARTQFFGQLQVPGKAKLILIRGDGIEGLSYQLNAEQHVVGRTGQLVFPDDTFVSPRHANLFYRAGRLVVRDEGSHNGVFWRVRGSIEVAPGDHFLAGEQLLRIEGPARANDGPAPDGTYFYSSPKHQSQFKLVQVLQGGGAGMAVCSRGNGLQIGREGSDLNFPMDLFLSAIHCKVDESGGRLTLTDLNSRNGTYIRLKSEKELSHGDYLFIGRKLLRVEITAN